MLQLLRGLSWRHVANLLCSGHVMAVGVAGCFPYRCDPLGRQERVLCRSLSQAVLDSGPGSTKETVFISNYYLN